MLLGVPLMAVIYYVAQKTVSYFLKKRGLTTDTLAYVYLTKVDKESNQPVYVKNPSNTRIANTTQNADNPVELPRIFGPMIFQSM